MCRLCSAQRGAAPRHRLAGYGPAIGGGSDYEQRRLLQAGRRGRRMRLGNPYTRGGKSGLGRPARRPLRGDRHTTAEADSDGPRAACAAESRV